MSIAPDLFDSIKPPGVWVTVTEFDPAAPDYRTLTLRVKPTGKRSITGHATVSVYSPEWSLFLAISHALRYAEMSQAKVTSSMLCEFLQRAVREYVEPF